MFFADVTFLMRKGLRLKRTERDPPRRYTVTLLESDRDKNSSARNTVEASLYVSYGTAQMAGRGRLTDPVLMPYKGSGFLWSGTELDTEMIDGEPRMKEFRQVWHILPIERQNAD
ncbi:hypothetical protein ABL840_05115 [Variovorax sp. NFACC27]|uniref:hypothetical protein n=1 Tax=unclassified Variovorax TaxID=663243 RepID=UPI000899FB0E|nr:hypothetical protein SAMN03159371_00155 [Variovorax sp. NFACC28]SEF71139.1 hypothetical protein SAMN03159365_00663 [Variovorax sp. NFACC29]SFB76704.1 hypothetical protein SAMN03159379_00662 [Variovorax sp. NFACC26]SFG76373.1 hypothetical protein SAMN03159447_04785 [Variovorax sp. NFACC27]